MKKLVKELVTGDKTEWYEVLQVSTKNEKVIAEVKFNDGGTDIRIFDNVDTVIDLKD